MNQDKLDEIVGIASQLLARSVRLEALVEDLRVQVRKLDERLTYKEKVLVGWNEISLHLGYQGSTQARALSRRNFDPLPVVRQGNSIIAHATALDAWKERQKDFARSGLTFDESGSLVPDGRMKVRLVPRETGETPS